MRGADRCVLGAGRPHDRVHRFGEFGVERGDPVGVVRHEVDRDGRVHVRPLRVVIEAFGDQRRALAAFEEQHAGQRIGTVGAPQVLVLLGLRNPTRYGFMMRGIANHVEARFPGGFDGWLASLDRDLDVLLTTEMAAREMGRFSERWTAWLERHYRRGAPVYGKIEAWERLP